MIKPAKKVPAYMPDLSTSTPLPADPNAKPVKNVYLLKIQSSVDASLYRHYIVAENYNQALNVYLSHQLNCEKEILSLEKLGKILEYSDDASKDS